MRASHESGENGNRIVWRWLVALVPLVLLAHEAHELAHTLTGRLVCGRWAERDFTRWSIEGACDSGWPTAAGPLLSYVLMAAGALLALRPDPARRWAAAALVFAANPLARLVTAISGHGDEMLVARVWAGPAASAAWVQVVTAGVVALSCSVALTAGWRALAGSARRGLLFLFGLMAGIAITGPLLPMLNRWLQAGILAGPVAGAPLLVHLVTLASAAGAVACLPWLTHPVRG